MIWFCIFENFLLVLLPSDALDCLPVVQAKAPRASKMPAAIVRIQVPCVQGDDGRENRGTFQTRDRR